MISFKHLDQHVNEEISLKGFLYSTSDGQTVLAPQPNLKSCCVGSQKKSNDQVFLAEEFPHTDRPVLIKGYLVHENAHYLLQRPVMEESAPLPILTITLIGLTVMGLLFSYFKQKKST